MATPLINTALIGNEHFEHLNVAYDLSKYDDMVNNIIITECIPYGFNYDTIPKDENDYATSMVLIMFGQMCYLQQVYFSYAGKHNGAQDVYAWKLEWIEKWLDQYRRKISKETIEEGAIGDDPINPENNQPGWVDY